MSKEELEIFENFKAPIIENFKPISNFIPSKTNEDISLEFKKIFEKIEKLTGYSIIVL